MGEELPARVEEPPGDGGEFVGGGPRGQEGQTQRRGSGHGRGRSGQPHRRRAGA